MTPSPPFIFQEELIQYQYNFIKLLNNHIYILNMKNNADFICYKLTSLEMSNVRQSFVTRKCKKKNPKNRLKLTKIKIANIDWESLHISWTIYETLMKLSEKMWFMIIFKLTKNQSFTLSLENTFLEKPQVWHREEPPSRFRVKYKQNGIENGKFLEKNGNF